MILVAVVVVVVVVTFHPFNRLKNASLLYFGSQYQRIIGQPSNINTKKTSNELDTLEVRELWYKPAPKWSGVDLRPAMSLAFTVCGLINFFTLIISPVLHASNNSRNGSLAITTSKFTDKVRLRLDIFVLIFSICCSSIIHLLTRDGRLENM